ncbi:serine protease [Stygiolobus caldivivus]|uniref:Serine protease n=1 Tax=Stygiolobus caldivivus TaxID=2824673 RepID=A0A8D5ZKN3_9CREN|nr:serine protease [Stygiolobus caldivivus]BCU71565.1 serine protease [Stygiolobus caldivivus]
MKKEYLIGILLIILIILAGIVGYLVGKNISGGKLTEQKVVNETTVIKTVYSSGYSDPASIGNGEDYLINPVFPDKTIASQYAYVTSGQGLVFIGNPFSTGNGYLAGAKGAAVVASMLAYQPLTEYNYYLYITAPNYINVPGAVKTDSATVMYLSSMLGQQSALNRSLYFLGDVGLEGYMYSTGVVYQRIVQLYQGGIYYLVVPKMMALAEGQNYQMAQQFAKEHGEVLYTVSSIPQIYQIVTSQQLPQPKGYIDFPVNLSAGYTYLSMIYDQLYNSTTNSSVKETASMYWSMAEKLASEGNYTVFYTFQNPAVEAIQILYQSNPSVNLAQEVMKAVSNAESLSNLWTIETAAEADYLYNQENISDQILANAWAALSLSISAGPTITPSGFYQGLYNEFLTDLYAAEYLDSVTNGNFGNVSLLLQVYRDPNVIYDYGFYANYYAQMAIAFRDYFLKQLNATDQALVLNSIYQYMANETQILESAAAYNDGPSLVGYVMMDYGLSSHNLTYLYYSMPFIRFTMNVEQLTWYIQT